MQTKVPESWKKGNEELYELELQEKSAIADLIYSTLEEDEQIIERYFSFSNKNAFKVSDSDLEVKRYYCYTCECYITNKDVRKHLRKGHEVLKITNPLNAPIRDLDLETYERSESWRYGKGVSQGLESDKCFYCFREEKPDFPLISVELYETVKGVKRVKVCPLCYYERFGKYRMSNKKYKDKEQTVLTIQRNYVISLKKVNPQYLAQIHNRIREELKKRIELYLKARISANQARYLEHLVEKRLAKLLPRYVIL